MSEYISDVDYELKRICIRTRYGFDIAKKMARLRLLEENVRHGELCISTIFDNADGEQTFVFWW